MLAYLCITRAGADETRSPSTALGPAQAALGSAQDGPVIAGAASVATAPRIAAPKISPVPKRHPQPHFLREVYPVHPHPGQATHAVVMCRARPSFAVARCAVRGMARAVDAEATGAPRYSGRGSTLEPDRCAEVLGPRYPPCPWRRSSRSIRSEVFPAVHPRKRQVRPVVSCSFPAGHLLSGNFSGTARKVPLNKSRFSACSLFDFSPSPFPIS